MASKYPPGLDGSTWGCHRYCSGCVSHSALSGAGNCSRSNPGDRSANERIEMLPTEPRETLLLVWKLAGDRVASPGQVPIGTPLDLIMVAPCVGAARGRQPELRAPRCPTSNASLSRSWPTRLRSIVPIPGLPSRGRHVARGAAVSPPGQPVRGDNRNRRAGRRSARIGAAERRPGVCCRSDIGLLASTQSTQVSQLQAQVNALIEQLVALVGRPAVSRSAAPPSSTYLGQPPPSDRRRHASSSPRRCSRRRGRLRPEARRRRASHW